jgi:FkbH-like protein
MRAGVAKLAEQMPDIHLFDLYPRALGSGDWYDSIGFLATQSVFTHKALPFVARNIARNMACLFRPRRKVLVLDLDNTLWGGVVGEDGMDKIALGTGWPGSAFVEFQRELKELRSTGILLAINSKNNEADARAVFEQRPEMALDWDDFSARRINWNDKATNLTEIADELGIGLESVVFADDSPMECALVRRALPQVEVVEVGPDPRFFMECILRTQAFDTLRVSEEDRIRAQSYAEETVRRSARAQVADLESFLADCDLRLTISPADPNTVERIHQLLGKTNQFNFTLDRPSKDRVQTLAVHGNTLFGVNLADRFGEYGLVGVMHLEPAGEELRILNMALSCRALGRFVEDAMLAFSREVALADGISRLRVTYVRGPRNQQVLSYLDKVGFSMTELDSSRVDCSFDLGKHGALLWPKHVRVSHPLQEAKTR